jgi:branched-subunit amino acid transport protein
VSDLQIWLTIVGLGLATFATRSGLLLVGTSARLPPKVESALRYAPACALAAIIVPDLLFVDGVPVIGVDNTRLLAALVGIGAFLLTRGTLTTIAAGMATLWLLQWLGW